MFSEVEGNKVPEVNGTNCPDARQDRYSMQGGQCR